MVAITLLIFSTGIYGGEFKLITLAGGVSAYPLTVDGPGAPVDGGVEALPLTDAWEDEAEEPASVEATKSVMPPALSGLFVILLGLRLLLG